MSQTCLECPLLLRPTLQQMYTNSQEDMGKFIVFFKDKMRVIHCYVVVEFGFQYKTYTRCYGWMYSIVLHWSRHSGNNSLDIVTAKTNLKLSGLYTIGFALPGIKISLNKHITLLNYAANCPIIRQFL